MSGKITAKINRQQSKEILDLANPNFGRRITRSMQNVAERQQIELDTVIEPPEKRRSLLKKNSQNVKMRKVDEPRCDNGHYAEFDVPNFFDAIQNTLSMQYFNVGGRLLLKNSPKCLANLSDCKNFHFRNQKIQQADINSWSKLKVILENNQPFLFLHFVQKMIMQNEFPHFHTIQKILELILTINCPINDNYYTTEAVIELAAFTFTKILEKFPPCWSATNLTYRQLTLQPLGHLSFESNEFEKSCTLFSNILKIMDHLIQFDSDAMDVHSSLNDSEDFQNFYVWETKNTQKFLFDQMDREDKIERVFLVLSLLVRLLENDLAMWMIKYLNKPSDKMSNSTKMPLIASMLWSKHEPKQINFTINNILALFVNIVSIQFPAEKVKILTRLINLVYNIFELNQIRSTSTGAIPIIQIKQKFLCDALIKFIQDNQSYGVDLFVSVINNIDHPTLKLQIIAAFLSKIYRKETVLTPKTIFKQLMQMEKDLNKYFPEPSTENRNNNSQEVKNKNAVQQPLNTNYYPYMQKTKRKAVTDLSNHKYAELLIIALGAYVSDIQLEKVKYRFEHGPEMDKLLSNDIKEYRAQIKLYEQLKPRPFDEVHMQQLMLDDHINGNTTSRIYSAEVTNYDVKLSESIPVYYPTELAKQYQEDIKYFDLICDSTTMPNLRLKFGEKFPKCVTYADGLAKV